jgi:hypothetical protein
VAAVKRAVREHWPSEDDLGFVNEYLESMPDGYLLSNEPKEIASHARVALRGRGNVVSAGMVASRRARRAKATSMARFRS